MRIVIEVDTEQLEGFNDVQRDFILCVMEQSICVPSVMDIMEVCARELVDLAGSDVEILP